MIKYIKWWYYYFYLPSDKCMTLSGPSGFYGTCHATGVDVYCDKKQDGELCHGKYWTLLYFKHMDFDTIHTFNSYRDYYNWKYEINYKNIGT